MNKIVKIIIVAALFVVCAGTTMAQSRFYHLAGDTVRGKSPIYHYSWWPIQNSEGRVVDSAVALLFSTSYMRHFTSDTLKIIGIASTMSYVNVENPSNPFEECDTTMDTTMFYILYNATPNGPEELARVCWTNDYITHPKRYIELPSTGGEEFNFSCDKLFPRTLITPLREYYFDSAITVIDSFYLGWERIGRHVNAEDPNGLINLLYNLNHQVKYETLDSYVLYNNEPCGLVPQQLFMFHDNPTHWSYAMSSRYLLVFPIIEIDTMALMPCATPATPTVTFHDNARARVEWVDYDNYEWTVAVAAAGRSPESGRMYSAAMTYIDLTGLNADSAYSVYVKGHCHGEIWSDWSLPCRIDALPNEGIEKPGTIRFSLSPNPAVSTVTVAAAAQQGTVTVIDMQGREMISCSLKGTETVLDIKALAAGTYIVKLDTPQGSSTQKLTVE